jgi:HK97 family phage major capsid protein
MLVDFQFDAASWIVYQVGQAFAEQEAIGFLTGAGGTQPQGLLTVPIAATGDATRAFGTVQYWPSGAAATLLGSDPLSVFQNMLYSLRPGYRQQDCVWLMNPLTLATIASLKDSLGRFLVQPSIMIGQPQTLLGKEIVECESMPVIAANAIAVVLINGMRAYEIVDRYGIRVLRDPFSNKPYTNFYTTKRVSGFVVNTQAVKFLKIAVS